VGFPTYLFLIQKNNMACLLTSGRKVPCKSAVGGLKAVYFHDKIDTDSIVPTIISGEITTFTPAEPGDWYKFDLKGTSSLDTAITSSRDNGTTFYESTLQIELTYLDVATQEQIKLLAHTMPNVAVEDYNGNFFFLGLYHGCDVTAGNIVTGSAMADKSGYSLTLVAKETAPPYFVASSVIADNASATQIDPTA